MLYVNFRPKRIQHVIKGRQLLNDISLRNINHSILFHEYIFNISSNYKILTIYPIIEYIDESVVMKKKIYITSFQTISS